MFIRALVQDNNEYSHAKERADSLLHRLCDNPQGNRVAVTPAGIPNVTCFERDGFVEVWWEKHELDVELPTHTWVFNRQTAISDTVEFVGAITSTQESYSRVEFYSNAGHQIGQAYDAPMEW